MDSADAQGPSGSKRIRRPGATPAPLGGQPGASGKRGSPTASGKRTSPAASGKVTSPAGSGKMGSPTASGRVTSPAGSGEMGSPTASGKVTSPAGSGEMGSPTASGRRRGTGRIVRPEPELEEDFVSSIKDELATGMEGESDDEETSFLPKGKGRTERRRKSAQKGNFKWRLLAGMLGAAVVPGVQAYIFRAELKVGWDALLAASDSSLWVEYTAMGGILFGALLVCGLIVSIQDRSSFRCLELGIAFGALAALGVTAHRASQSDAESQHAGADGHKELPPSVRMAEFAANPGFFGRASQVRDLEAAREKLAGEKKALGKKAEDDAASASQALAAIKNELTDVREKTQAERQQANAKVEELSTQLEQTKAEAEKQRALNLEQAQAAETKLAETQARLHEALKELEALRQQSEPEAPVQEQEGAGEGEGEDGDAGN